MSSVKIIKINKSLKNKKTLYKDILSSSETIKNILKKKKSLSNTLNSYNNIKKIEKCNDKNSNNSYEVNNNSVNSNSGYGANSNSANSNSDDRNDRNIKKNLSKKNSVDFFRPKYRNNHNHNNQNTYKSNNIKNYFQKKSIVIKIFTKDEIVRYIKVLNQFSCKDQYKIIHKYIRKLNKFQTIQILYALKLIKNKSNAPENLLKTMLFSYFTCYLTIIK